MRFILETITGRKGIKNFSSLEEYVDFMTKNGDKIKNIVESDLPYDDKPVSVAAPSQSNGWEQVNKATFGDVIKKAEKGDCILPHKASSVFKDEAKFEPSKSSEKADTSSEPKVDSTPVKNNNEGNDKDLPKFEYKNEEKSSSEKSEPKEEKENSEEKDDKKEQVDEGFKDKFKKAVATGAMAASLAAGNAHGMTQDPYYDGATRPYEDSYEQVSDYEKPQIKQVKPDGTIVDQYGNQFTKEQFEALLRGEDPYDDNDYHPELTTDWMNDIEECLRIAGVQLNEAEDDILELDEYDDEGINLQVLQELYEIITENYGDNWLSDYDNADFMEIEDAVKDFGNEIDGYDDSLRHDYALALVDKWSENHQQKNIDESEHSNVDNSLIDKISNDPNIYNQGRDEIDDGQEPDNEKIINSIDYIINNYGLSGRQALKAYSEATYMDYDTVKNIWESDGSSWDENDMPTTEDVNNPNDGDIDEKTGKEKLMEEDPSANFNQDEVDDLMTQYEKAESDYRTADFYDDNYSWNKGRKSASSRMNDINAKLKELTGKSYDELLNTLGSKQVDEDKGPSFKVGDKFNKNGRTYEIENIEKSESKSRNHQYTNYWYHVREINGSHVDVFTDSLMKELGFKPIAQ